MLDPALTRLVAVNSIYFKGLWKSRFQPQSTKMRSFTGGDGKTYKVPMMSQLSVFNIGDWFYELFVVHTDKLKSFHTSLLDAVLFILVFEIAML